MLINKLFGTSSGLVYVGGNTASTNDSLPSVSLTSLTGGIDTRPRVGDIVIACATITASTDQNISIFSPSGYTELFDLYANDTYDSQLGVFWKIMTAEDTAVQIQMGAAGQNAAAVHVWRSINSTPFYTSNSATILNSGRPDAPAVTTTDPNTLIVVIGSAGGNGDISALTAPTGFSNFVTVRHSSNSAAIGIASNIVAATGSYDPPTFGGGSTNTSNSACAVTLALRPL